MRALDGSLPVAVAALKGILGVLCSVDLGLTRSANALQVVLGRADPCLV